MIDLQIIWKLIYFSSDVDEYGFKRPENFDYKTYEGFMSNYLRTLAKRRKKWEDITQENIDLTVIGTKLKRYIRKGIPGNVFKIYHHFKLYTY